jgi:Tol biopolymer transport system component
LRGDGYNIRLRPLANRDRFFEGTPLFRRGWGSRIDSVAWAPSGRAVAFSAVPRGRPEDDDFELFTVRVNGTRLKRVTRNDVDDVAPAYSPRGRMIAFERKFASGSAIYTIRQNGRRTRRHTFSPDHDSAPDFSPDGRRLAFCRYCFCSGPYDPGTLLTMLRNGRGLHDVIGDRRGGGQSDPDWGIRPGTRRGLP